MVEDIFPVMVKDALITSHPVSTEIRDPEEIQQFFDMISYNKVMLYNATDHHDNDDSDDCLGFVVVAAVVVLSAPAGALISLVQFFPRNITLKELFY